MTTPDAFFLTVLLLAGLMGFSRGAIRQLTGLIAWTISIVVPYLFANPLAHFISDRFDTPYIFALIIGGFVLAVVSHLITRFVLLIVGKILRKVYDTVATVGDTPEEKEKEAQEKLRGSLGDRILGAGMGLAKWGLVLWVILSGVALISKRLHDAGYKLWIEPSKAYAMCAEHNAFSVMWSDDIDKLSTAFKRLSSPPPKVEDARKKGIALGPPERAYETLSQDERVKAVLGSPKLRMAIADRDFQAIAASTQILDLLTDPRAMEDMARVALWREPTK